MNRCTVTRSLYREPREENVVINKPSENREDNNDLEGVIASQTLSSLVTCTLPLKYLLRVKPRVWKKMANKLNLPETNREMKPLPPQPKSDDPELEHVSIIKMSKKWDHLKETQLCQWSMGA